MEIGRQFAINRSHWENTIKNSVEIIVHETSTSEDRILCKTPHNNFIGITIPSDIENIIIPCRYYGKCKVKAVHKFIN